jgi:hypothetical protein
MGMYGVVLGIGPFKRERAHHLQQPEAWDFNTHALVPERVRIGGTRTRFLMLRDAGYQFHYHLEPAWGPPARAG